jgi:hypothetical protein
MPILVGATFSDGEPLLQQKDSIIFARLNADAGGSPCWVTTWYGRMPVWAAPCGRIKVK